MRPLFTIPFLAFVIIATFAQEQPDGTWLDSAPVQWNRAGASIPVPAFVFIGPPHVVGGTSPLSIARLTSGPSAYKKNGSSPAPDGWFSLLPRVEAA